MNNVEKMASQAVTIQEYAKNYLNYLSGLLNKLDLNRIADFINELNDARENENTVFIAGNGGSSATASHMENDFGLDVMKKRNPAKPYRIMSLTNNVPVMTAIGNDNGYENLFLYQLKMHYRPGDKLVVISASGNSVNLVDAVNWVKERGGKTIALTGFDGGKLKEICDIVIHAETPKGEYGPVEDVHMIMDHLIVSYLLNIN